ncbi:tol-pal system YbgF family protein [Streptomyces sp. NPDC088387]|uniref:tetratricopeptide repeat protein n=1 Tax=Streptomyces sp. NPDC088387 TaxID=3365859 RepID=UPI0038170AFD
MSNPTYFFDPVVPEPVPEVPRVQDPWAVAIGNASLLGVGYLMVRKRALAVVSVAVTVVLVSLLVSSANGAYQIAVLAWWALVVAHGWFLAHRSVHRGSSRGMRVVAVAVTLPVLLAVGLLRLDASDIGQQVTEAREKGDCAEVTDAQDGVWFGNRAANAPLAARGDDSVAACDRLSTARSDLTTALTGDTESLSDGFDTLESVLAEPGNDKTVETTLNSFLGRLETRNPCGTVAVTDWLRDREPTDNVLDRSVASAERVAPGALAGCGKALMEDSNWEQARSQYARLLDLYPDDRLADQARGGVRKATQNIELANVRTLLAPSTSGAPEYCSKPAKYSGAKARGKGTNRAMFFAGGSYATDYSEQLPGSWKASDAADAVLVVCMGEDTFGTSVETCPYEGRTSGSTVNVTFHKIEIPVKVYELRTGKLVSNRKLQVGGESCPAILTYYTSSESDTGPPRDRYVDESGSDVKAAFRSLIVR